MGTFGWKTDGKDTFRTVSLKRGNEERTRSLQNLNPLVLSERKENGFDLISDGSTPSSKDSFCLAAHVMLRCSIGESTEFNVNDRCAAQAFRFTLSRAAETAEICEAASASHMMFT